MNIQEQNKCQQRLVRRTKRNSEPLQSKNQLSSDISFISFRVKMSPKAVETVNRSSERLAINPIVIIIITGTICIIIIAAIICFYIKNRNYLSRNFKSVNLNNLNY